MLIVLGLFNWFVIASNYGVTTSQTIGYFGIILSLLCIPMGIKYFRDKLNNGRVSFGQAFKIGMSITLIVSLIMFFYGMLFFVFQGEEYYNWQLKGLQGEELAEMQAQLASLPDFAMTPWFQGIILSVIIFLIGFAMTLLSAFLLRYANAKSLNKN